MSDQEKPARMLKNATELADAIGKAVASRQLTWSDDDAADVTAFNMTALIAAQIITARCISIFAKVGVPWEVVGAKYREVMNHSDLADILNIVNMSVTLPEQDSVLGATRLAGNAVIASGEDHRLAVVRLLAAVGFIADRQEFDVATLTSLREQAAEIAAVLVPEESEPNTNAPGGSA